MLDNRRDLRQATLKTGTILCAGETTGVECVVLNSSTGGLCLLVASPGAVADKFDLIIEPGGFRHSCTVAWKTGNRIGVRVDRERADAFAAGPTSRNAD
jgi:hypothetical protein